MGWAHPTAPQPPVVLCPYNGDMLDERAKSLLKTLVERYIADGHPVGSRTLSKASGLELSPATIRNVMADLEELGLIASPHTSAGRVPTVELCRRRDRAAQAQRVSPYRVFASG